jgi:hypothetical protein
MGLELEVLIPETVEISSQHVCCSFSGIALDRIYLISTHVLGLEVINFNESCCG